VTRDCHQSATSHPRLLEGLLNAKVTPLSCTGSTTYNGVLDNRTGDVDSPRQLGSSTVPRAAGPNPAYDAAEPDLVTLSVGANDLKFADEVSHCYSGKGLLGAIPDACGSADDKRDLKTKLDELEGNLGKVLQEIKDRGVQDGKVPVVALTEYIDPFPASFPKSSHCYDVNPANRVGSSSPIGLNSAEFDYLRNGLRDLNDTLERAAAKFENVVAVPAPTLDFHRFCSDDPWVFGPSIRYDVADIHNQAPFHPTADGQRALAENLIPYVRDRYSVRAGDGVPIQFPSNGPRITFSHVTVPGSIAVTNAAPGTSPSPTTFNPQQTFDITSSVQSTGATQLSIPATSGQELYHYTGGAWEQVQTTYSGGRLQGSVTSFSPFAVGTPAPEVDATLAAIPDTGSGVSTSLDASGSSVAAPGSISSYDWDFGDGSKETTADATAPHTWAASGTYEVSVTVHSAEGSFDVARRTVVVTNAPPTLAVAPVAGPAPGQDTALRATATDPESGPVQISWDFGDGTDGGDGANVTHAWREAGTYAVTTSTFDDEGLVTRETTSVTVATPPAPGPAPGPGTDPGVPAPAPAPASTPAPAAPAPAASAAPVQPGVSSTPKPTVSVSKAVGLKGRKISLTVLAPAAGKASVSATTGFGRKRLRALTGSATTKKAGPLKVRLKPTRKGLKALKAGRSVRVAFQVTFKKSDGTKVSTTRVIAVKIKR
jgi:PKD repeat protein/lysophospholipase L1-like esterase